MVDNVISLSMEGKTKKFIYIDEKTIVLEIVFFPYFCLINNLVNLKFHELRPIFLESALKNNYNMIVNKKLMFFL